MRLKFPRKWNGQFLYLPERRTIFCEMKCPRKSAATRITQKDRIRIRFDSRMMLLTRCRSRWVMDAEYSRKAFPAT